MAGVDRGAFLREPDALPRRAYGLRSAGVGVVAGRVVVLEDRDAAPELGAERARRAGAIELAAVRRRDLAPIAISACVGRDLGLDIDIDIGVRTGVFGGEVLRVDIRHAVGGAVRRLGRQGRETGANPEDGQGADERPREGGEGWDHGDSSRFVTFRIVDGSPRNRKAAQVAAQPVVESHGLR